MIDTAKVRTLLKFEGITTEFTDEELQILIESKLDELEGLIGANIRPRDRTKTINNFKGKVLELNFYPITQIVDIIVDCHHLNKCDYHVNKDLGIIYFNCPIQGHVTVQYSTGLDDRDFSFLIIPLIKDMVAYTLTYEDGLKYDNGISGEGRISSLKEGDVSIGFSYDSSLTLGARIYNRIDELKSKYMYSARVRWL